MGKAKVARLADRDEDFKRFGIERDNPQPFEDGLRTSGGRGSYEWWYTDMKFSDGTTIVVIFFPKNYFDADGPAWPVCDFEVVYADGRRENVFTRGQKGVAIDASTDGCNVSIGKNFIRYEDGAYHVRYDDHGYFFDAVMRPKMPMWRPKTGHWLFGEGAEEHQFCWFVAVPEAEVSATFKVNGESRELVGMGYHDHNWGDVPMQQLLNHWYWGRAHIGPYNVIACDIIAEEAYGNKRLPVFMFAKDGKILADDESLTVVQRAGTHAHPFSGKFMDDTLTYTQREGDGLYTVTFQREHDYNNRSLLEVVPPWKRVLAKAVGLKPTYIRVGGTVTVSEQHDSSPVQTEQAQGLWEQYFLGSNKLATIEGVTYPLE